MKLTVSFVAGKYHWSRDPLTPLTRDVSSYDWFQLREWALIGRGLIEVARTFED